MKCVNFSTGVSLLDDVSSREAESMGLANKGGHQLVRDLSEPIGEHQMGWYPTTAFTCHFLLSAANRDYRSLFFSDGVL